MRQLWQNLFNNSVKGAYSSREAYSITLSPYKRCGLTKLLRGVTELLRHLTKLLIHSSSLS